MSETRGREGLQAAVHHFRKTLPYWQDIYSEQTVYSTIYRQRLRAALELVDELGPPPGKTALEIGCGPGFGTVALARRGLSVGAIDALPIMVRGALRRAEGEGVAARVEGVAADVHALPFASAAFDLIFMIGVTEWLGSLARPFAEIARVLKPGGHLVVSADNAWALQSLLDPLRHPLAVPLKRGLGRLLRAIRRTEPRARTRAYAGHQLDAALRRAGLARTAAITVGFGPFTLFNRQLLSNRAGLALHRGLQKLADRGAPGLRSGGLTHLVVARKTDRRR